MCFLHFYRGIEHRGCEVQEEGRYVYVFTRDLSYEIHIDSSLLSFVRMTSSIGRQTIRSDALPESPHSSAWRLPILDTILCRNASVSTDHRNIIRVLSVASSPPSFIPPIAQTLGPAIDLYMFMLIHNHLQAIRAFLVFYPLLQGYVYFLCFFSSFRSEYGMRLFRPSRSH